MIHDFLRSRRSIRRFRPNPVPDEILRRILETAIHAPSAHNLQPWRFVIVQGPEARTRLADALTDKMRADMAAEGAPLASIKARANRSRRRLVEAPVVILLCRDTETIRRDEPEEHHMGVQSVAAAGLQLLLAAHAEGLGGNWICWPLYAPAETSAALSLPKTWTPQAMFFLGYPAETPGEKTLRAVDDVVIRR